MTSEHYHLTLSHSALSSKHIPGFKDTGVIDRREEPCGGGFKAVFYCVHSPYLSPINLILTNYNVDELLRAGEVGKSYLIKEKIAEVISASVSQTYYVTFLLPLIYLSGQRFWGPVIIRA